jgi:NitT/TauT family transport system permease protein
MNEKSLLETMLPWIAAIGLLLTWEIACRLFRAPSFILPTPTLIVQSFVQYFWPIMFNAWQTLVTTVAGFVLAIVGGLALGVAIGASRMVYGGLYPMLIGFNAIPKVAVVPILVIWFGSGVVPAILTAFMISFFPIVVNVATGLATIEPEMKDMCRSLGATKSEVVTKIGIPRAMPYLFASLKVAITLAFVGAVLSETINGSAGIGYMMIAAAARFDTALVFAGLVAVAVMAIVMYVLCSIVERRMTRWAFRGELVF